MKKEHFYIINPLLNKVEKSKKIDIPNEPNCYGCIGYEASEYILLCISHNKNGKCPCTNCIVKPICNERCENNFQWLSTSFLTFNIQNRMQKEKILKKTKQS